LGRKAGLEMEAIGALGLELELWQDIIVGGFFIIAKVKFKINY